MISKLNHLAIITIHLLALFLTQRPLEAQQLSSASAIQQHQQQQQPLPQHQQNNGLDQQHLYRLESQQISQLLANSANQQLHHASTPGHYEFVVAAKMEPPSVRKPPYQQSGQVCSGTDLFAGFSPRDTLCGDLNRGYLPLNPLGQLINDQSYPFEVIKNKTLQFLARALPVLKMEYETIPKVARYLPTNHLLNPTHQASPLSSEHMQQLNQRFGEANGFAPDDPLLSLPVQLQRRRKRSVRNAATLPELSPNATLMVVSSAHSAGRIGGQQHQNQQQRANSSDGSAPVELAVITKDGYKSIQTQVATSRLQQQQQQQVAATQRAHSSPGLYSWAPASAVQQSSGYTVLSSLSPSSSSSWVNDVSASNKSQKLVVAQQQSGSRSSNGISQVSGSAANANNGNSERRQVNGNGQQQQAAPAIAASGMAELHPKSSNPNHATTSSRTAAATLDEVQARSVGDVSTAASTSAGSTNQQQQHHHQVAASSKQESSSSSKRKLPCADSTNGFTSVVCQAAASLIEGDRPPAWLQVAKHLSSAYWGSSPDGGSSGGGSASPLNPIWSLLGSLAQDHSIAPKSSSGASHNSPAAQSKSAVNLMSVLAPLGSLLTGGSSSSSLKSAEHSSEQHSGNNKDHYQPLSSALSSLGSSTMTKLALAGYASNALAHLVEYFVPSVFHSATRSFAKRKKPFDPSETFVDTPASVAAALGAKSQMQAGSAAAGVKQPPTPCPSVEEYISPTFARNYQGQWKYVVQIPGEGYFTQTIQRTSCVNQRCEFTDGVCHESPRWVSLLVAEIYYPNTIFGQAPGDSQQQTQVPQHPVAGGQLSTSSSTNSIQQAVFAQQQQQHLLNQQQAQPKASQDPLQMTDSLSNYNHNLNSAFINAANELGWDPNNLNNMQHLANAYNYQLMQRNGLSGSNLAMLQPVAAEARSSSAAFGPNAQMVARTQQQQQAANQYPQSIEPQTYSTEYIASLAAAALQQNPNLNLNELISSLGLQQTVRRRKRDVNQQRLRTPVEAIPSINNLNTQQVTGQAPAQATAASPASGEATASTGDGSGQECDGHDKIGCYVVRVYYDWFLVNGSCKCWKTSTSQTGASSTSGNSFLRRIFTG